MWITALTRKIEEWTSESEVVYKIAERYYQDVIQKEVVLANITSGDQILCIGGGICPFSAILLHRLTGAKVTVIDNNSACVKKARQVITRMGIENAVKVLCEDGRCVDVSKYTVVHFALQVFPMECVFSHIESRVVAGTKLLVRQPKRQVEKLYNQLPKPLQYCPLTTHSARNIGCTLLYVKVDSSADSYSQVS
ncbi:MAG: class I SAM-dependent methyltransferase [Defluviitaleaceae bacterium]|nr:class I SAM-dependent methyltransferase [Defluviitaleaceae bacterium]